MYFFDGENISFDASLVIYINSTNIPPIIIINRIYEHQNLLSLYFISFLVGIRTYQHPCSYLLRVDTRETRTPKIFSFYFSFKYFMNV